ncbi:hypothetical protein A2U01_0069324, partial [Trifolium medium]|nr:hypothetical protein [Trifolium medium]
MVSCHARWARSSDSQRQKATKTIKNPKIPDFSERKQPPLAGILAGQACP